HSVGLSCAASRAARAGRARPPAYTPFFRPSGFPAAPIAFALTCLAIVANQIAIDPRESLTGLALVVAGLPVYYLWSRTHARDRLSQPLLPAKVHAGAAIGREQRQGDRRWQRQPEHILSGGLQ